MQTNEAEPISDSAVIALPAFSEMAPAETGSYEAVRFNAMKHGILSKLAVLAHEDHAEDVYKRQNPGGAASGSGLRCHDIAA